MSRMNENRLGMVPEDMGISPPPTVHRQASSLEFVTPTDFVELPSNGKFYPVGHVLHNQDVLEIKHMTTKEEDILTSVTLLKKGIALDRMLQSLILDSRILVDDLLVGDKNALIIAARISGYGALYETATVCPSCAQSQEYSFDLEEFKNVFPSEEFLKENKIQVTEQSTFLFTIPKSDLEVEVRLGTSQDEKTLSLITEHKKKRNLPETPTTDVLRTIIVSVNGVSDTGEINGFINNMPTSYSRHIRRMHQKVTPSVNLESHFECAHCDHEGPLEVPLSVDFFWVKP